MGNNNEISNAGDAGRRDSGDDHAGRMRDDSNREASPKSYESAKATMVQQLGPMNESNDKWLSQSGKPEVFHAATQELLKNPEQSVGQVTKQTGDVQTLIASIGERLATVVAAQKIQEDMVNAQRGQA